MNSKYFFSLTLAGLGVGIIGLAPGCGGSTAASNGGSTASSSHSSSHSSSSSTSVASSGSGGGSGATNTSFASAVSVTVGGKPTTGTLPDPSTPLYYSFTGTAGDRVVIQARAQGLITTTGHDPNDPTVTDTVVSLYLPDKSTLWAQDDDAWPRLSTDSVLYTELPATGTYYFTLEDCNGYKAGLPANSGVTCAAIANIATLDFDVFVGDLTTSTGAEFVGSTSTPATVTYKAATGATGAYNTTVIDGNFTAQTDAEVFNFTPPANITVDPSARSRAFFWVQPYGSGDGDGTSTNVVLTATDANNHVLAQADQQNYTNGDDPNNGPLELSFPFDDQFGNGLGKPFKITATVSNSGIASPTKSFYIVEHYVGPFNYGQPEKEKADKSGPANDTAATAEALTAPKGVTGAFFIDGNLSSPTDVDWYSLTAPSTAKAVFIGCEAARAGSGLRGFTAQLFKDATGTTSLVTIGPEAFPAKKELSGPAAGSMLGTGVTAMTLQISLTGTKAGQDTTVAGTYYHCSVNFQ